LRPIGTVFALSSQTEHPTTQKFIILTADRAMLPRVDHKSLDCQLTFALKKHQAGDFKGAYLHYKKILDSEPANFTVINLTGVLAAQINDHDLSLELFSEALSLNPKYVDVYFNRAKVLATLGQFEEALADYSQVIDLEPFHFEAFTSRAVIFDSLDQSEEALSDYTKAIALNPTDPRIFFYRGETYSKLRKFSAALDDYSAAISLKPDFADALNSRGIIYKNIGQPKLALKDYKNALSLIPQCPEIRFNIGVILQSYGSFEKALIYYNTAIALKPNFYRALNNRGLVLQELRCLDSAMADYNKAISFQEDYVEAHWNKSLQLLSQGDFLNGWKLYEWRWKTDQLSTSFRDIDKPLWLGQESLDGKTILIYWEQGFGDTIQFFRYAYVISKLNCRVLLQVQDCLVELLKNCSGTFEVLSDKSSVPDFDFHCPLMSLPLALKTTLTTIPFTRSYISSDKKKTEYWSAKLGPKRKPRIGVAWSGSKTNKNDFKRSITLAQALSSIPEEFEIISLQKELRVSDNIGLEIAPNFNHFGENIADFSDTAALCELMDIIVSVDTCIAHLAGALGKNLFVLLPYNADFRWLIDRVDNPWYDTAVLYRQGPERLWDPVLRGVKEDLYKFLAHLDCG